MTKKKKAPWLPRCCCQALRIQRPSLGTCVLPAGSARKVPPEKQGAAKAHSTPAWLPVLGISADVAVPLFLPSEIPSLLFSREVTWKPNKQIWLCGDGEEKTPMAEDSVSPQDTCATKTAKGALPTGSFGARGMGANGAALPWMRKGPLGAALPFYVPSSKRLHWICQQRGPFTHSGSDPLQMLLAWVLLPRLGHDC